jgi:hypothetical protein
MEEEKEEFEPSGDPAGSESELTEQSAGEADPGAAGGGGDGGAAGGLSRHEMLEREGVASTGPDPEAAKPDTDQDQAERMEDEGGSPSE